MKCTIKILIGVCLVLAIATGIILAVTGRPSGAQPDFVPPEFDLNAVAGTPTVPENLGWYEVYKTGMSFKASVCGEIKIKDKTAKIYFTSPQENTLWLKLRILNEKGEVLGETALIKPGEYVPEITFETLPKNGKKIILKLMSYQPETYYSGGSASLTTVAQIEGD